MFGSEVKRAKIVSVADLRVLLREDEIVSLGEQLPLNCLSEIFDYILPACDFQLPTALYEITQSPLYDMVSRKQPIATALYFCRALSGLSADEILGVKSHPLLDERYRLLGLVEEKCVNLQFEFEKVSQEERSRSIFDGMHAQLRALLGYVNDRTLPSFECPQLERIPSFS